jgi:hypothetical protein
MGDLIPLISFLVFVWSCACAGVCVERVFRAPMGDGGTRWLMGYGAVGGVSLILMWPGVLPLIPTLIVVQVAAITVGALLEGKVWFQWLKGLRAGPCAKFVVVIVIATVLLHPIWTLQPHGDEFAAWASFIKEAFFYGDIPRASQQGSGIWVSRGYFGLSSLATTSALAWSGAFHGGVGRLLTVLVFGATLWAIHSRFQKRHGSRWAAVGTVALLLGTLVPFFPLHFLLYTDTLFATFLLLGCLSVTDFISSDDKVHLRSLGCSFAFLAILKPDGFTTLVYFPAVAFLAATGSWRIRLKATLSVGQYLLPGLCLFGLWKVYGLVHDFGWAVAIWRGGYGAELGLLSVIGGMLQKVLSLQHFPPLLAAYGAIGLAFVAMIARVESPFRGWFIIPIIHFAKFAAVYWLLWDDAMAQAWGRYVIHAHYVALFLAVDLALSWLSTRAFLEATSSSLKVWVRLAWGVGLSVVALVSLWAHFLPREEIALSEKIASRVLDTTDEHARIRLQTPRGTSRVFRHFLAPERHVVSQDETHLLLCLPERSRHSSKRGASARDACLFLEQKGTTPELNWRMDLQGVDLLPSRFRRRGLSRLWRGITGVIE